MVGPQLAQQQLVQSLSCFHETMASRFQIVDIHIYIHKLYFSSNLRVAIVKANFSEKTITKITKYTTTY